MRTRSVVRIVIGSLDDVDLGMRLVYAEDMKYHCRSVYSYA